MSFWDQILGRSPKVSSLAEGRGGNSFFEYNGKTIYLDLNCEADYKQAYLNCAPLKAVVNRRAQMFVNGRYQVINKNTESELKGGYAKEIETLLCQPNVLQSYKQFKAQQNIYIDIFGYCPVLKVTPEGRPERIKALWNLPPWLFDIEFTGNWYNQTEKKGIYKNFYLNWNGQRSLLDYDSVFLILDNSIGTDNDGNLNMPDSRVKSLEYPISNYIASGKALNTLISKKGAIGILSNKGKDADGIIPLTSKKKEEVQNDFSRYGITGQEWQVIITDADLQWQAMSSPVRDMMLFETMDASMAAICNGMGMYAYIMASSMGKGTTFTNLSEAKKAQYQDFIIPDDEARTEQLSANIITENRAEIKVDYSHIEALQDGEKQRADALGAKADAYGKLYDLGLVTRNMILKELKMKEVAGKEEFEKYKFEQTLIDGTTPENTGIKEEGGANNLQ